MQLKRFSSLTIITIITVCLMSCVSTLGCLGCTIKAGEVPRPFSLKPQESFGLVTVETTMTPTLCSYVSDPSKDCDVNDLGLEVKVSSSIGSSIVVGHNNSKTYSLTAAHVCSEPSITKFVYRPPIGEHVNVVIEQTVSNIKISDYSGKEREASVYRLDKPNDLCVLTSSDEWGMAFVAAKEDPVIGEKVYNVASPHRIWAPGMVLMMDGYYSGKNSIGFYHYTIPARPGSSGSPILNVEGKIVGMVQRAVVGFENLAISTSAQAIREILSTLPNEEDSQTVPNTTKLDVFTL